MRKGNVGDVHGPHNAKVDDATGERTCVCMFVVGFHIVNGRVCVVHGCLFFYGLSLLS